MTKTDSSRTELRRCKRCGATKTITLFVRHSGYASGYMSICKECRNRTGSTSTSRQ